MANLLDPKPRTKDDEDEDEEEEEYDNDTLNRSKPRSKPWVTFRCPSGRMTIANHIRAAEREEVAA